MTNSTRGSRAALAAMVVAVMAMSAVSANAAQSKVSSSRKASAGQTVQNLRRATINTMIRFWEPFGELPILNIPRAGLGK